MTYHNHLEDSLKWRVVGRLEVSQSQVNVTRWLQVARNLSPAEFQTSRTVYRIVSQYHNRTSKSTHNRYLALIALRHRLRMAPQLARELASASERRNYRQTVYNRHAETSL
ncbi:hypothetical protein TNCV_3874561 [Trichonephila clavipes]|nr:hypothetical protein TNCV_3874561 [Trichonephila clavipes]